MDKRKTGGKIQLTANKVRPIARMAYISLPLFRFPSSANIPVSSPFFLARFSSTTVTAALAVTQVHRNTLFLCLRMLTCILFVEQLLGVVWICVPTCGIESLDLYSEIFCLFSLKNGISCYGFCSRIDDKTGLF